MGLVGSPEIAAEATGIVPLIVGFNGLFLVCFALLAKRGLLPGLVGALLVWFLLSLVALQLHPITSFAVSVAIFIIILVLGYHLLHHRLRVPAYGRKRVSLAKRQLLARALFSGWIIASAVFLSKVAGPVLGGVLAAFPAVFISTLVIAYRSGGADFARALTRPLLLGGMVNVVAYAISVRYLYPLLGLTLGTIVAFIVAGLTAYAAYLFVRRRVPSKENSASGHPPLNRHRPI
jgi:hypothetical protein